VRINRSKLRRIILEEIEERVFDVQYSPKKSSPRITQPAFGGASALAELSDLLADPNLINVVDREEGVSRLVGVFKLPNGKNQAFYRSSGESMGWGSGEWYPIDGWATFKRMVNPEPGGSVEDSKQAWWVKTFKYKRPPEGTYHYEIQQRIHDAEKRFGNLTQTKTVTVPNAEIDPKGAYDAWSLLNGWLRDANAIRTAHAKGPAYDEETGGVSPGRRPFFGLYEQYTKCITD